jgi:hypothetical protein
VTKLQQAKTPMPRKLKFTLLPMCVTSRVLSHLQNLSAKLTEKDLLSLRSLFLKTELSTEATLRTVPDTVPEPRYGLMVLSTKVNGASTKQMERVNSGMQMVTSMKDSGKMTKQMVMESTCMSMELNMKAIGEMIFRTAQVSSHGLMVQSMKAATKKV